MLLTGEKGYPYGQPKRPDGSLATPPLARLVCRNNKASMPPRLALFMNGSFSSAHMDGDPYDDMSISMHGCTTTPGPFLPRRAYRPPGPRSKPAP